MTEETRMDAQVCIAAIEGQFLMGHCVPAHHVGRDQRTIIGWSWDADQVRQHLHVPLNALWSQRVLELEMHGLASLSFFVAPVTYDEQGNAHEIPGWQDQPREHWGSVSIHPRGVLRLAELYGRPYVRYHEAPAVLAHWQLVQAESEARLHTPHDEGPWKREWPERALFWQARLAQPEIEDGED